VWESGTEGYLGVFSGAGYTRDRGLASARRLRPHRMLMPYFRWTRLGQGPAGTRENRHKREQDTGKNT